jgi:ferredoxin
MPKLTVEGVGTFEVAPDRRLVLALEEDAGVDQMHACGGNARCTTCRVEFVAGEPDRMTRAEKERLAARGLSGVRLSCQILCDHDMTVRAISRVSTTGAPDPGPTPAPTITPAPEWTDTAA